MSHAAVQISVASAGSPSPLPPVDAEVLDVSDVSDPQAQRNASAAMHKRAPVLFPKTEESPVCKSHLRQIPPNTVTQGVSDGNVVNVQLKFYYEL